MLNNINKLIKMTKAHHNITERKQKKKKKKLKI